MASQLFADLYGCDAEKLNDPAFVNLCARQAVADIGATIVEECSHAFSPIGISYIAVISTSHFSIHTWPEYGYAAVDVFSCDGNVPEKVMQALADRLQASAVKVRALERQVCTLQDLKE